MLKSIIKDKAVSYLKRYSLIRDSHHGFRHTMPYLSIMMTFYNDFVYLDSQKAFDKVPHNKLMFKVKYLGINGKVHNWRENWLSNRKQG